MGIINYGGIYVVSFFNITNSILFALANNFFNLKEWNCATESGHSPPEHWDILLSYFFFIFYRALKRKTWGVYKAV